MPKVQFTGGPLPSAPTGVGAFLPGETREVSDDLAAYLTTNPYFLLVEPATAPIDSPASQPDQQPATDHN